MEKIEQQYIPVKTSPVLYEERICALAPEHETGRRLSDALDLPVISSDSEYSVFVWNNPLDLAPKTSLEYPEALRSFKPLTAIQEEERFIALAMIQAYGSIIPYSVGSYGAEQLNILRSRQRDVVIHEVPNHQARGFRHRGVFVLETTKGPVIKLAVCTKGSGMSGYWKERRTSEMLEALDRKVPNYPLNPDSFHARDHTGQSVGQQEGDETVWVGCASEIVTLREVNGFRHYTDCGIFHPQCLPVKQFEELPLSTGDLVPVSSFTQFFDRQARLVYLAKAWGLETRIWGNHFSHEKLTAAHILSSRNGEKWTYEKILDDLLVTAPERRLKLDDEERLTVNILRQIPREEWSKIFGFAGKLMETNGPQSFIDVNGRIIPSILSVNMIDNVARAGANRLFGKPVAWHFENIGRWGEVSGGERIYGKMIGAPEPIEIHSLFAYLFDAYSAVAVEWAAAGKKYMPLRDFFKQVRDRMLKLNNNHWISSCRTIEDLVSICKARQPDYRVNFRSEDTYPLIAVPGTTDHACTSADGKWKDWPALMRNMNLFFNGIRETYLRSMEKIVIEQGLSRVSI